MILRENWIASYSAILSDWKSLDEPAIVMGRYIGRLAERGVAFESRGRHEHHLPSRFALSSLLHLGMGVGLAHIAQLYNKPGKHPTILHHVEEFGTACQQLNLVLPPSVKLDYASRVVANTLNTHDWSLLNPDAALDTYLQAVKKSVVELESKGRDTMIAPYRSGAWAALYLSGLTHQQVATYYGFNRSRTAVTHALVRIEQNREIWQAELLEK